MEKRRQKTINSLDIGILSIISLSIFFGIWKGLISQLFSLAGVVIGYIAAANFYRETALLFAGLDEGVANIVGFLLTFVFCIVAVSVAGWLLGKLIKRIGLNWADRTGGGLVGLLKGMLIIIIIVTILTAFLPANSKLLAEAVTLPYVISSTKTLNSFIPDDMKSNYNQKIDQMKSFWLNEKLNEGKKLIDAVSKKHLIGGDKKSNSLADDISATTIDK